MSTQKVFTLILTFTLATFFTTSCSDSSTGVDPNNKSQLKVKIAKNIPANADAQRGDPADFTFYDLTESKIIPDSDSASTQWDIAFSATNIITNSGVSGPGNGGAVVLDEPFKMVNLVNISNEAFAVDTDSSLAISGWYRYTGRKGNPPHAVLPIDNTTIVVQMANGKYAKIKILSYYKGNPDVTSDKFSNTKTRAPERYYTFKYAIQLNDAQ